MKMFLGLLGVVAACAACCVPLALPLMGGLAASGMAGVFGWEAAALAGLAAAAGLAVHLRRRRAAKASACESATGDSGGCGTGCARGSAR